MTYQDLLNELKALEPEQLRQDVAVHLTEVDEYIPARAVSIVSACDVLDLGHIILTAKY